MSKDISLPSRKELEHDLAALRDASASIDLWMKTTTDENQKTQTISELFETQLKKQRLIIDKFISLSEDRKSLQNFTRTVKDIQLKLKLLKSMKNSKRYVSLKMEILHKIEEWMNCLEKIIIGVIKRASD